MTNEMIKLSIEGKLHDSYYFDRLLPIFVGDFAR